MRRTVTILASILLTCLVLTPRSDLLAQDYIGSTACINCHTGLHPDVVAEYQTSGHPYKLNAVDGVPPLFPAHTSPGVPNPPPNTEWSDFSYVIGGYGWKARFVKTDGFIFTAGDSAQYNLLTEGWVAYHKDEARKYNYACFRCHTTGASAEGSWNGVDADSLGTFTEPGIRCEGCHGPGSEHAAAPANVKPPNQGEDLTINRCGDCHQRGGITNAIPASGNYIRHHEQLNEMRASKHGDGAGAELTCASCHNAHVTVRYPDAAGAGMAGITTDCETCHPNQEVLIDGVQKDIACIDCHMAEASKSAVGMQLGNGWRGDVKTHIMAINTAPETREAMFTEDGGLVQLDVDGLGAVTLDFACLGCHTNQDVAWAATYAANIHLSGINTDVETVLDAPAAFALEQNYPNPFNPTTTIAFSLPHTAPVALRLYTVTGQLVETLVDHTMPPGRHTLTLDAGFLASGIYVYELRAGDFVDKRSMVLIR